MLGAGGRRVLQRLHRVGVVALEASWTAKPSVIASGEITG